MKQLWHKAKALFGFGPQEAETSPSTAEDIAAEPGKPLALFKDDLGYVHRTSWEADHLNPTE